MSVKTLRFGPLPSKLNEKGETPPRSEWDKFVDIPPDTRVRVIATPGAQVIFDGPATRSWSRDLDPGKYRYVMSVNLPKADSDVPEPYRCIRAEGEFLVDMTEAQFQKMQSAAPKFTRTMMTSDGPKWICERCNRKTDNRVAAFLHESVEHHGIDPLKEPERLNEAELAGSAMASELRRTKKAKGQISDADLLKSMSRTASEG